MNWIVLLALTGAPLLLGSASPPTTPAQRDAQLAAQHDDLHSEPRAVATEATEATEAGMVRFDGLYQAAYADYFFICACTRTAPRSPYPRASRQRR